jgi:hypothetical protein
MALSKIRLVQGRYGPGTGQVDLLAGRRQGSAGERTRTSTPFRTRT